jgi:hypothetical protein
MPNAIYLNTASPANQPVLTFLHIDQPGAAVTYRPDEINPWGLGTHPDLVEYLWGFEKGLPEPCACVIHERSMPLFINSSSGIIFALAGGTSTLAFRLPEDALAAALAVSGYGASYAYPKSTVYAKDIGADWALIKPFAKDNPVVCRKAYEYAGTL